jgi:imidazolonepropionase-like amidohydrolase
MQAMVAATPTEARVLNSTVIGRVPAGAQADVVIVRGDPTAAIGALRTVEMVLQRGNIVKMPPR